LNVHAVDWREAVAACGDALAAGGVTTPAYTGEMIATVEQLGPYIVIAPGIALAHARPSPAVLRAGLAWVTLAAPVRFGHQHNDPVRLVVGLAAPDNRSHVRALATLAGLLEDAGRQEALLAAQTPEEIMAAITAFEQAQQAVARAEGEDGGHGLGRLM
jgi:PTS system ascorbate-specific IIA component